MADSDIQFKLGMNLDDLFSGLNKASDSISKSTKEMGNSFGGLGKGLEALKGPFLAISGILAGGAMFKEAIDSAKNMGSEVRRLSEYFGVSNQEAGLMAESLKRMGSSADDFIGNADKVLKQVRKNEDRFNQLGVATRGSNGELLQQTVILDNVAKKLNETEEGTNRNMLAQELAGKGGKELALYMQKYAASVEATEKNLKKLGVAIDYDQLVAGTKKYNSAMADINQMTDVMKVSIGSDLMPALTDLATTFADVLPPILKTLSVIIKGIVIGFDTLIFVIKMVGSIWGAIFGALIDSASDVIDVFRKLSSFDFKGAWEASKRAATAIVNNFAAAGEQIAADYQVLGEKIARVVDGTPEESTKKKKKKKIPDIGGDKDQVMAKLQKELEDKRQFQAQELQVDADFYALSKKEEFDFWTEKLTHYKVGSKEYAEVAKQVQASRKAMRTEELAKEKTDLEISLNQNKFNFDAKIKLAEENLAKQKTRFAEDSTQVKEAEKLIQKIKQESSEAQTKILETKANITREARLSEIDDNQNLALQQKNEGKISNDEYLQQTLTFENQRYEIKKKALDERLKLLIAEGDLVKAEELKQQLAQLSREHNKNSGTINLSITNDNPIKAYFDGLNKGLTNWQNSVATVLKGIESAFTNAFSGMLSGQMSLSQGMQSIWKGISGSVVGEISKQLAAKTMLMAKDAALWVAAKAKLAWDQTATKEKEVMDAEKQASDTPTIYSGLFSAFASIPFGLGIPLAIAAIAGVMGIIKSITARATGGLVDSPQLSLIGEAGPEVVAPLHDFKDFAASFVSMGASMYGSIAEREGRKSAYSSYSSEMASGIKPMSKLNNDSSINHNYNIDLSGAYLIGTDKSNMEAVANQFKIINNHYDENHG